jgi:choline dehydrogenase-like flavoprotein
MMPQKCWKHLELKKDFDNECYPGMAIHEMGTARMGNDPKILF